MSDNYLADWNSPFMTELREAQFGLRDMPNNCKVCVGNKASNLNEFVADSRNPRLDECQELYNDAIAGGTIEAQFSPSFLRYGTTRRCTLGCIMCTPWHSQTVEKTRKNAGFTPTPIEEVDTSIQLTELLEDLPHVPKVVTLLGGEPLLSPQMDSIMEWFRENPVDELIVFTNGMPNKTKGGHDLVESCRGVDNVTAVFSIDGDDDVMTYQRLGANLERIDHLLVEAAKSGVFEKILINVCITNITALRLETFVNKFIEIYQPLGVELCMSHPTMMRMFAPNCLPVLVKTELAMRLSGLMREHQNNDAVTRFIRAALQRLTLKGGEESWSEFCGIMNRYDQSLGRASFADVFEEIAQHFDHQARVSNDIFTESYKEAVIDL
jgi:organic radical activating enzyme